MDSSNIFNVFVKELFKSFFLDLWWVWLFFILALVFKELAPIIVKNKKFSAINNIHSNKEILEKLRKLTPREFEYYIAFLFSRLGFKTERVGGSYDGGVDVIAEKDGIKHYIQCKKFISSQVSVGAVRDFYGSLVDKLSNGKGYFITTNKFTLEAEKFVETKPIELIDGFGLMKYVKLAELSNNEYFKNEEKEKCPKCGGDLIERRGKYGKFFGCSNFPKCRFIKNIK